MVGESGSDPLFMSGEWLQTWWEVFGEYEEVSWAAFGAFDHTDKLVGAIPLFERAARVRKLWPIRRLEWFGGFWYGPSSVLSQYPDILGECEHRRELVDGFMASMADRSGWDELVIDRVCRDGESLRLLSEAARSRGWLVRLNPLAPSMVIDLDSGFEAYRAGLGAKTRRRVFNSRKRLEGLGSVEIREVPSSDLMAGFGLMNELRIRSRDEAALSNRAMLFHELLVKRVEGRGQSRLTFLLLDGVPVSVNYALQVGCRVYGIQLGYDAEAAPGLSLGTLHVGYAVEAAAEAGAKSYDLLGGEGPGAMWKSHLANRPIALTGLQIVRSRPLAWLYQAHDRRRARSLDASEI